MDKNPNEEILPQDVVKIIGGGIDEVDNVDYSSGGQVVHLAKLNIWVSSTKLVRII